MSDKIKDDEKNKAQTNDTPVNETQDNSNSIVGVAYSALHSLVAIYAIYLSFKCNNGFHLGAFILAICCPWLYVLYHHAVSGGCVVTGNRPLV